MGTEIEHQGVVGRVKSMKVTLKTVLEDGRELESEFEGTFGVVLLGSQGEKVLDRFSKSGLEGRLVANETEMLGLWRAVTEAVIAGYGDLARESFEAGLSYVYSRAEEVVQDRPSVTKKTTPS